MNSTANNVLSMVAAVAALFLLTWAIIEMIDEASLLPEIVPAPSAQEIDNFIAEAINVARKAVDDDDAE